MWYLFSTFPVFVSSIFWNHVVQVHFVNAPSQWESMLPYNIVCHGWYYTQNDPWSCHMLVRISSICGYAMLYIIYTIYTVYPKKYAHGFCFAVLCCGYTLTDFPISIRLTSLALWQSNDCPSASKATLMNMDKYFMWIHYERLHNHNKANHNKTVCIFLGIYCNIHPIQYMSNVSSYVSLMWSWIICYSRLLSIT